MSTTKQASTWVQSELLGRLNADGLSPAASPITPVDLGRILERLADKRLSGKLAKAAFARAYDGEPLNTIFAELGEQVVDPNALYAPVQSLVDANPAQVDKYLAGNTNLIGWFIGQVMKSTGGRANPQVVRTVLVDVLESKRE